MNTVIEKKQFLPPFQTAGILFITAWTVFYIFLNLFFGKSVGLSIMYFGVMGMAIYSLDGASWMIVGLILLFFVPGEANVLFTGISYAYPSGHINLHVLSYYVLGGFIVFAWHRFQNSNSITHSRVKKQVAIFGVALAFEFTVEVLRLRGSGFSNYMFDIFLCPILMYQIAIELLRESSIKVRIIRAFGLFTLIASLYGILEYIFRENVIFDTLFETQDIAWYYSIKQSMDIGEPYRITSFYGHPLTNAAFFLAGFIIMATRLILKKEKRLGLIITTCFSGIGLILTFSRYALLLASILILWVYIRMIRRQTVLSSLKLMVIGASFIGMMLPLAYGFMERDTEGTSVMLRIFAIKALIENGLAVISFLGYGPQNIEDALVLLTGFNTGYNLEIGYAIVLLQYGVVFTTLYLYGVFQSMLDYLRMKSTHSKLACYPYAISLFAIFCFFAGSNTIGVRSTINYLFFLLLAFMGSPFILDKMEIGKRAA